MSPKVLIVDDNQEFLSLLARLFSDAGYQVITSTAGKDAIEQAHAEKPSLMIIDILLPDMMGYNVAEAVRRDVGTPIIFITGVFKGGKHGQEARAKYGAVAYFEKPFEASRLLETARGIAAPETKSPTAPPTEPFEVELDIDIDIDVETPEAPLELTGMVKISGAELFGETLTASVTKPGTAVAVRPPPDGYPEAPQPIADEDRGIRRGDLKDNLPALINAFYQSQQTGELGVHRGKVKKEVYFEKGKPVFARSNLVIDRFGQFLVRVGKIDEASLAQARATAGKRRIGEVLIEMGLLKDETERLYYAGQQAKSIIYSMFGWEDGVYELSIRTDRGADTENLKLDVHPAILVMRGIRKIYRADRLQRLLGMDVKLAPSRQSVYSMSDVELEKWELEIFAKADGSRTVGQLIGLSNRPQQQVHGLLYGLVALTLLEQQA